MKVATFGGWGLYEAAMCPIYITLKSKLNMFIKYGYMT